MIYKKCPDISLVKLDLLCYLVQHAYRVIYLGDYSRQTSYKVKELYEIISTLRDIARTKLISETISSMSVQELLHYVTSIPRISQLCSDENLDISDVIQVIKTEADCISQFSD